jgi:hypothetical protein
MLNLIDLYGFDLVRGGQFPVLAEGQKVDPEKYKIYAERPSRMGGRFIKVSREVREMRKIKDRTFPGL